MFAYFLPGIPYCQDVESWMVYLFCHFTPHSFSVQKWQHIYCWRRSTHPFSCWWSRNEHRYTRWHQSRLEVGASGEDSSKWRYGGVKQSTCRILLFVDEGVATKIEHLLSSYELERLVNAKYVLEGTEKSTKMMTLKGPLRQKVRNYLMYYCSGFKVCTKSGVSQQLISQINTNHLNSLSKTSSGKT